MKKRDFLKSAALAAGLIVAPSVVTKIVTETSDAKDLGRDFYVWDFSEDKEYGNIEAIKKAFQRSMKKNGFTKVVDLQYERSWHPDRVAYLHRFMARLV